jgi:hypothetical protein
MSCCGSKRAAMAREQSRVAVPITTSAANARGNEENLLFKYVGPGKLTLKGASSGKNYVFARTGAELPVSREDSVGMMSHRYLRLK